MFRLNPAMSCHRNLETKPRDSGADVSALERETEPHVYSLDGRTPGKNKIVEEAGMEAAR